MVMMVGCGFRGGPRPPGQPSHGPGGQDYLHNAVKLVTTPGGAVGARVYLPQDPAPSQPLPLVVFLHGYQAMETHYYSQWLTHLVRRGAAVVFPMYMERYNLPTRFTDNARAGLDAGLAELAAQGVEVDFERVVLVGHSGGGTLAVNLAVLAGRNELPVHPQAMVLAAPGRCVMCKQERDPGIPVEDAAGVPANMLLAVFGYDQDWVVGKGLGQWAYERVPIARDRRTYLSVRSDLYGYPELEATHRSPAATDRARPGEFVTDAMDYFGTWKITDALMACAFDGQWCDVALGEGPAQRDMGDWADGTPVRPMVGLP